MSKTILIVDDQPSFRQMIRFALQFSGYKVVEAADGLDALAVLGRVRIDLLISDWMMPNMNGIELLRALRAKEGLSELPVVMVSCQASHEAQRQASELKALMWLRKPFRMSEIQSIVESVLGVDAQQQAGRLAGTNRV